MVEEELKPTKETQINDEQGGGYFDLREGDCGNAEVVIGQREGKSKSRSLGSKSELRRRSDLVDSENQSEM